MRFHPFAAIFILVLTASCAAAPAPEVLLPPAADCPEVRHVDEEGVEDPVVISNPIPVSPNGYAPKGVVTMKALIDCEGYVRDIELVEGRPGAAKKALAAVAQWRFRPATLEGRPISVRDYGLTLRFR